MRVSLIFMTLCVALLTAVVIVAPAGAAEECNGIEVCLPAEGPWVVVPATGLVHWDLKCPRRGYIVAGTDARVSDRGVDVSFRAEVGSPVGPGRTTTTRALFTARNFGAVPRRGVFKPFIGCMPPQGGGSRGLTAVAPARPLKIVVATTRRFRSGQSATAVARCAAGARLVDATHAVGFLGRREPPAALLGSVTATRAVVGRTATVRGRFASVSDTRAAVVQVIAYCTAGGAR